MRRLPVVLAGVVAVGVLQTWAPAPATAGPALELCTLDTSRGGVPATFVLDACADPTSLSVRNSLDVPVVVRAGGNLGFPLVVHRDDSTVAGVLSRMVSTGTLLMPGDVVRWPLGAAAAELAVEPLAAAAAPAVVETLARFLPDGDAPQAEASIAAFADVVEAVSRAVDERVDCAAGKNFLRTAACDVAASAAIGRAVFLHLPRGTASEVRASLSDPLQWAAWHATAAADGRVLDGRELRLAQLPIPIPPPPPPPPAPEPPQAPGPARAPAPARTPAPALAATVPATPVPATPVPATPVPAQPPVAAPLPAPPVVQQPVDDGWAEVEEWLRAAAERERQEREDEADDRDEDRDEDRGNGRGKGRGNGRGDD
ncbi:hypothetical protein FHU33_3885 [Blastococcus colisei]|uniref:Uncharacterized protein n=1 Tax=Blastococcus colisei TaxID=1564162 RepID=A0A543PK08_9ACTN|nr:hypothetical protein [Blastococcus colisei]TQN44383.1 hypothetical protein FHU33_3885 [Blastococcus colisei]